LQIIFIIILQISYIAAHGIQFYVLYIVFFAEIALSSQATAAKNNAINQSQQVHHRSHPTNMHP